MSAEKEKAPAAQTTGTGGVSNNADVVTFGLNGMRNIEFIEPAPGKAQVAQDQPTDCFAVTQRSKHWLKTMRQGEARWKRNGGEAR